MMRISKWIVLTTLFLFAFAALLSSCGKKEGKQTLTEEQIKVIEIANNKGPALGIEIESSNVYYDVDNEKWKEKLARLREESPNYAERFKVLEGRDYQTVIYSPKENFTLGGVFWVFIDREAEEVITALAEQ